jgi:1-phosphofructokinase family hexose kinase
MSVFSPKIIAVALNPSIDRGIEVRNFTIGAHQQGQLLYRRPAGKAVNLARTLGRLNIPCMLIGFVGKQQQEYFERYTNNDYVSCQLFGVEGKTRENITIIDPVTRIETHIRDKGSEITLADINKLRKKLALLAKPDTIVVFSGSVPPGMSNEDFFEMIQICQMNNARICVDSGGTILKICEPLGLWMIKPNREELIEMMGLKKPVEESQLIDAGRKMKSHVGISLVSLGSEGALLFSPDGDFRGRLIIKPEKIKNTVGAGDAMLAGFIAGIIAGKSITDTFAQSLATATASTLTRLPSNVRLPVMQKLLSRVQINPI